MRDPKRINKILLAIRIKWNSNPDLRLGQLLENLQPDRSISFFYMEDDLLLAKLLSEPTIDQYGNKEWRNEYGLLHRDEDLPAIEFANGTKEWYQNGHLHRLTGPAVTLANGHKEWWVEDRSYTEEEFKLIPLSKPLDL